MRSATETVAEFFRIVRSGAEPDRAGEFLAATVLAHQVRSGSSDTIRRDPEDYAAHVREMLAAFGDFTVTVEELIAEGEKVYVRWVQDGWHRGPIAGFQPTGLAVRVVASAVYRVDRGRIIEYWIQQEDAGLLSQLELHARESIVDAGGRR